MSVTDDYLSNNAAYALTYSGPLPVRPSKHLAVVACMDSRLKIFGLLGMGVAPAGFEKANTGHHHLLVDSELPPFDQPIPNDFNHLHFGAGQTEAKITLPLGPHKLRLLFADSAHVPHDPPVYSDVINVTVTESGRPPKKRVRHHRRWRHY